MYIKTITGYVDFQNSKKILQKGKLDNYTPPTFLSTNYCYWKTEEDLKVCVLCSIKQGELYPLTSIIPTKPPLHIHCRCTIENSLAVKAGQATKDGKNGADYWLAYYGTLPNYYIDTNGLKNLGWHPGDKPSKFAPGKMYTAGKYQNSNLHLPDAPGRTWYEADINYTPGKRNRHRVVWSNDSLIFVTYDHYNTFYEIVK